MEADGHASSMCPAVILNCSTTMVDLHRGLTVLGYTAIATGSLSCVGALLIIYTYFAFKDLRTSTQTVITLLAVADVTFSVVVVMSGINYFAFVGETNQQKCKVYDILCTILAYGLVWSACSFYTWNSALALHFCLLLFHRVALANRLIPVYNIIGWGLPITIALPMLVLGKLSKNPGQICLIKAIPGSLSSVLVAFFLLVPEIISGFLVAILYGIIIVQICRKRIQGHLSTSAVQEAERRLLLIPCFYLATHIWDAIFYAVVLVHPLDLCKNTATELSVYAASNVVRVFANSSQGFLNFILYVLASKEMRKRLFHTPLTRITAKIRRGARKQQEEINARSPLIVREDHRSQVPPRVDRTSTYFSFPTEFSVSGNINEGHTVESNLQSRSEASFPAARLRVEWSCTHLSLPSEFPTSDVRALESHQNTALPPESQSEQSFTYVSLPSEFPLEMKPCQ